MKTETQKVKSVGYMENGTGRHQSNTVYDADYICPTITTIEGGGTQQIKVLVIIEDFYSSRDIRVYKDYSPTIRSERIGLKVVQNN